MKGKTPFHSQQVHYEVATPNPVVEYIETEEVQTGTGKRKKVRQTEVVKTLLTSEYNKKFPLSKERFGLQDLIDAGVSLREVPTKIYEDDITQSEILNQVEKIIDNKTVKDK